MAAEKVTATPPLTPARIEALKPRADRYEVADGGAPGLRLRVMPTGAKVFRWYVTSLGRVITIGPWSRNPSPGHFTLGEAHTSLEKLKLAHKEGRLAAVEAELQARRPARRPPQATPTPGGGPLTVKSVADEFLKYVERERKRPEHAKRPVEFDILPAIGHRPIAEVTPQECRAIVEGVVARGSPTQAGAVLAVMKQFFRFACDRDDIVSSPAERFRNPRALGVTKNVSQRFLDAEEIAAFWKGLDSYKGMTPTVRNGLKLLLLTGVRSGELLRATWDEIDKDAATWTIPVAHQKLTKARERTARPWTVPLSPLALRLVEELRGLAETLGSKHVMASFHPASPGEALTEKSLNHAMRRLFTGKEPVLKFEGERPTPHDLRRTVRTHLGETLGIPWHVAERCLNHSLGKITTTYDVGDYLAERRAALEKWAAYVERLVAPGEAKVAFLRAKRK
jgi:integrase